MFTLGLLVLRRWLWTLSFSCYSWQLRRPATVVVPGS